MKALAFKEGDRYPSALEFVQELVPHLLTVHPPRVVHWTLPKRLFRQVRIKVGLTLAATLLLTALAFGLRAPHFHTSMVVFEINDLVDDPAYQHLSAGLTAELVSRLIHVDGLSVKQYYSTRAKASLASISERFYLDGDLQKFQNRLHLTMRLTDTEAANSVVWAGSFDRDLGNSLALETEVSNQVAEGLENRIYSGAPSPQRVQFAEYRIVRSLKSLFGAPQVQVATTQSPAAYQAYLRGRELFEERTPMAVRSAIQSLAQAVTLDPNFALAYAALSDAYRAMIDGRQGSQEELAGKSLRYAEKAVSLNPQLPEAHAALAGVQQMQWNWEDSERNYREAIRLDPKSPIAYRRYGGLLLQFGRFEEALGYVRKGLELDPYDYPSHSAFGMCLMIARRYQEAEDHLKSTLAQKDLIMAHNTLGTVYAIRGRESKDQSAAKRYFDLALAEAKAVHDQETKGEATKETTSTPVSDYMFAMFHAMRGDRAEANRMLQRLASTSDVRSVSAADLALIYCALGETDKADSYLEEAARMKDRALLYLKVEPLWDPIHNEDAYKKILLTMKM
jgi:tetratricopeptide (TPR) repeat protein/TolB-like protein